MAITTRNAAGGTFPGLAARGLTKTFPGVLALQDVTLDIAFGEVHALFGENGAGKSTLVNLLVGNHKPDAGRIILDGKTLNLDSPASGRESGINAVFQEFSLIPTLSIAENIFLGREEVSGLRLNKKQMRSAASDVLRELGFGLDPDSKIERLSRAEKQMVEIAKAVQGDPKVLILDEPTASLTEKETEVLFALIQRLRKQNLAIIYITHRIQEIQKISDRVTVLRDGQFILTIGSEEATEDRLIELMTGRKSTSIYPSLPPEPPYAPVLELMNVSSQDGSIAGVSLQVSAGEIVGLAGLVGSGKEQVGRLIFGLSPLAGGEIRFQGAVLRKTTPRKMLKKGLYYLPADRRSEGLFGPLSLEHNSSIAAIATGKFHQGNVLRRKAEQAAVLRSSERMSVRPWFPSRPISAFSGGNQQKALITRGLLIDPSFVVLNEPTTGVDVGARAEIYELIADLSRGGVGVLLISSDLPEVLHLCHRAYSVADGAIQGEFAGPTLNEAAMLTSFFRKEEP